MRFQSWRRAIAGLKECKVPGGNGNPAEVWKHGGEYLFSRLHKLITNAWDVGSVPQVYASASFGRLRQRLWKNHHMSMRVKGNICRAIVLSVHPPIRSPGMGSVQSTSQKATCLHDATSAFDHEDNLAGQSDKQGNTRIDMADI